MHNGQPSTRNKAAQLMVLEPLPPNPSAGSDKAVRRSRRGVVSPEFPVLSVPTGTLRIILSVPPKLRVPGAVI